MSEDQSKTYHGSYFIDENGNMISNILEVDGHVFRIDTDGHLHSINKDELQ